MAWTQNDLDRLNKARRAGARRVTFADGRSIDYDPTAQAKLASEMERDINSAAGNKPIRRIKIYSDKDL